MTLRRQEAKLDVTTTGTPEASFLYDTGDLFQLCYKKIRIGLHVKIYVFDPAPWDISKKIRGPFKAINFSFLYL